MSVESFKTRVSQVNLYLSHMPNFWDLNKPFELGDLQTIYESAMPKSWQTAVARTGIHEDMSMEQSLDYMKRMERLNWKLGLQLEIWALVAALGLRPHRHVPPEAPVKRKQEVATVP